MIDQREEIIRKAREKYIEGGHTRNITEALKMYLENDAGPDEQVPLFITSPELYQLEQILSFDRPLCGDCTGELKLQLNATDQHGQHYPTAWVCGTCQIIYYSEKTPARWLKEFTDANR